MTPKQALAILSEATEPQNLGRLTRASFVAVDQALQVFAGMVAKLESPPQEPPKSDELSGTQAQSDAVLGGQRTSGLQSRE